MWCIFRVMVEGRWLVLDVDVAMVVGRWPMAERKGFRWLATSVA
jgi:hypothetical protein